MTPERVDAIAQGRVWTGRQAKENGLVDEIGGLDRAIELVKTKAKITSAEVEVVVYPTRKTIYEILSSQWSGSDERLTLTALLGIAERRGDRHRHRAVDALQDGEALALLPFGVFARRSGYANEDRGTTDQRPSADMPGPLSARVSVIRMPDLPATR